MKKVFLFCVMVLLLSSCATVINHQKCLVEIESENPQYVTVDSVRLPGFKKKHEIHLNRSNEDVVIKLSSETDSLEKTVVVEAYNSRAFDLNVLATLGIGMLVDRNNPKRYVYPAKVSIDNTMENGERIGISGFLSYPYIIKTTPLKIFGMVNPSLEVAVEKVMTPYSSLQVMGSWLLPESFVYDDKDDVYNDTKGFRTSVEYRIYLTNQAPIGPYFSTEFEYLKNQYRISEKITCNTTQVAGDLLGEIDDSKGVDKEFYSLNFKLGIQADLSKRFYIDTYMGLGLRYRRAFYFDENPICEDYFTDDCCFPGIIEERDRMGEEFCISIPLNIRIGLSF